MAEDWLADVRKYDADADENIVASIVRYCGIALRTENASKVTFADPVETGRVRDNFLKKKMGLTQDDASLDAAIAQVGQAMGSPEEGNRVTIYYLLTKHFGMFDLFGGSKTAGASAVASAGAAAATAASATTSAASAANDSAASTAAAPTVAASGAGHAATRPGGSDTKDEDGGDDMFGIGCIAGLVAFGAIFAAALISVWTSNVILTSDDVAEETVAAAPAASEPAPEPVAEPEPEVPEGAGVTATERDGRPMLTVYFDSGSAAVSPDFGDVSSEVLSYLEANPDAKVEISGFNDPTGNAELNAELSKNRAENVQAALVAAGVAQDRTDLVKPDDTTTTEMAAAEARRVEIVIVE